MRKNIYHTRVVTSGPIVEIYQYEVPIVTGQQRNGFGRGIGDADETKKAKNRVDTLRKARQSIRRLVNANIGPESKFVTLTFKDNVRDFKVANYEFKKFVGRLKYFVGKRLKYLVVPEFHRSGVIHYHVVFFSLPYVRQKILQEIWGQGIVDIRKIRHVDNLGAYVCKYLNKGVDDQRLVGKKCYFTSRNLEKPKEFMTGKKLITEGATSLPARHKIYESSFHNDHTGTVMYQQYNLNVEFEQCQKHGCGVSMA